MKTGILQNKAGIISGFIVGIGILLWILVSKTFLIVVALGAFGPGVLRELGWLNDHDEFQRQAAYRAGYHAYLAIGVVLAAFGSFVAAKGQLGENSEDLVPTLLVLLWLAWMFSSLINYWGAAKMTSRLLMVFGSFWAVFVIASLIGGESNPDTSMWESMLGVLFGVCLIGVFFLPSWTAFRWPKQTGIVLIVVASILLIFFYSGDRGNNLPLTTILLTDSLLILPLYVCGIALIKEKAEAD